MYKNGSLGDFLRNLSWGGGMPELRGGAQRCIID